MRRTHIAPVSPREAAVFEVRDALAEQGCPICMLALRSVGRFIDTVAYDSVNDVGLRAHLRTARGFCNVHAYRWLREAHNVLGTAQIYRDVVRAVLSDLAPTPDRRVKLIDRLRGRRSRRRGAECLACAAQHDAEDRYLGALAALLVYGDDARQAFDTSDGLCLPHALRAVRSGVAGADIMVLHSRLHAERLIAVLDEVIRKEDYRFRDEARTADERRVPVNIVGWTIGQEGLID